MDLNICESLDCKDVNHDNKVEPGELLEDCWFFCNLLDRNTRNTSRSFSDPSTSSNFSQQQNLPGESYEETYESIKKLSKEFVRPNNLTKAPSLPPRMERRDRNPTTKRGPQRNKKLSSNNLLRAPSLPTSSTTEEFDYTDEEIEFSMGKLIRQASFDSKSNTLPTRTLAPKSMTPRPNILRIRSKKEQESQGIKQDSLEETRSQRPTNRLKSHKSLNDIESQELQGFKDLGLDFRYKDLKAQIKFWAREVASNTRQER